MPDYYLSKKSGYVREHVYFYEQYHKVCVLKWAVVHHIDGNQENNMPWNLEGMMRSKHISYHQKIRPRKKRDTTNQFCKYCKGKTYIRNGYEHWFGNKIDGWICETCYQRIKKTYLKKKLSSKKY